MAFMLETSARLRDWSDRFRKAPLAASVVASLDGRAAEIWRRTFDLLQRESPEYRNSVDEEFTRESQSHCKELLRTIVDIATGRGSKPQVNPFAFVRTHAEWRARRQVPLIASLHAYRLAHKTYGQVTRELLLNHSQREDALVALATLADFWIEFFDYVGSILADAHSAEENLSVARNTRAYSALVDGLLRGIEPRDADARRLRTLCGIRPGVPMVVVVARSTGTGEEENDAEPALRSLLRVFQQALPSTVFGKVADIQDTEVRAIVCSDRNPGPRFLQALRRAGVGPRSRPARLGVSSEARDVATLPAYLREARLAVEFATPAQPLMHFADIDLTEFLIRRADKDALRLIPDWACQLSDGMSQTIRAFADCNLNVKQTAGRLGVHPNTVYFRLNQISKLTRVDPRTFSGALLLVTALRLLDANRRQ